MPVPALSVQAAPLFYGPARRPLPQARTLFEADAQNPMPFHGIISRGLMRATAHLGKGGPEEWGAVAPILEELLNHARAGSVDRASLADTADRARGRVQDVWDMPPVGVPALARLLEWLDAALEEDVLSFRQSTALALESAYVGSPPLEVWNLKEGHTASVWRVRGGSAPEPCVFGLNVARDRISSGELKRTFTELQRLHAILPANVARVDVIDQSELAAVARVSWIDDARELAVEAHDDTARFVAVDEWVSPHGPTPGGLQNVRGERLSTTASDRLWCEFVCLTARLTTFHAEMRARPPHFELNEGDLVIANGRLLAIAVSEPGPPMPIGEWLLRCLLPSAGNPTTRTDRLHWNIPELALIELARQWSSFGEGFPSLQHAVLAARQVPPAALPEFHTPSGQRALSRAMTALRHVRPDSIMPE